MQQLPQAYNTVEVEAMAASRAIEFGFRVGNPSPTWEYLTIEFEIYSAR